MTRWNGEVKRGDLIMKARVEVQFPGMNPFDLSKGKWYGIGHSPDFWDKWPIPSREPMETNIGKIRILHQDKDERTGIITIKFEGFDSPQGLLADALGIKT